MEFPITKEQTKKFDSWIDPDTGLGYIFYLDFRRAENSTEKYVAVMWDHNFTELKAELKLERTKELELRPKR